MKVLIFEFIKRIYIRLPKAIKRPTLQLHRFIDLKCHLKDTQYVYGVELCNYDFRYHRYIFDILCDNMKYIFFHSILCFNVSSATLCLQTWYFIYSKTLLWHKHTFTHIMTWWKVKPYLRDEDVVVVVIEFTYHSPRGELCRY